MRNLNGLFRSAHLPFPAEEGDIKSKNRFCTDKNGFLLCLPYALCYNNAIRKGPAGCDRRQREEAVEWRIRWRVIC